jgi:hypothetical protein
MRNKTQQNSNNTIQLNTTKDEKGGMKGRERERDLYFFLSSLFFLKKVQVQYSKFIKINKEKDRQRKREMDLKIRKSERERERSS